MIGKFNLRIFAYIVALVAVTVNVIAMLGEYQGLNRIGSKLLVAAIVLIAASLLLRIIWPPKKGE